MITDQCAGVLLALVLRRILSLSGRHDSENDRGPRLGVLLLLLPGPGMMEFSFHSPFPLAGTWVLALDLLNFG